MANQTESPASEKHSLAFIFTIPSELHNIWDYNLELMTQLLFAAVKETLFELLEDPKYLGGTPGIIAAIHTWNQKLFLHPHIHCLITGGGISKIGEWLKSTKKLLLPPKLVMYIFRKKLTKAIRKAYAKEQLILPPGMSQQKNFNIMNKIEHRKYRWNVKIMEEYKHGEGVASYLARYLKGGPIANSRIVSYDGETVIFKYKDRRGIKAGSKGKTKTRKMPADKFIHTILRHVPKPYSRSVRSWGIYSSTKKEILDKCREQAGQAPVEVQEYIDWQTCTKESGGAAHPEQCPVCGKQLVCTGQFKRGGVPPPVEFLMEKAA